MTMTKKIRRIPAGEFKAKCLRLLDEVSRTGQEIVVTKRGKEVARVLPMGVVDDHPMRGTLEILGDIVSPLGEEWECEK